MINILEVYSEVSLAISKPPIICKGFLNCFDSILISIQAE